MFKAIIKTNGIYIPSNADIVRIPPRRPEDRQSGYLARFDFHGLFTDIFFDGDRLIAIGPPYLNLIDSLRESTFYFDGAYEVPSEAVEFVEQNRISRTTIELPTVGDAKLVPHELSVRHPEFVGECSIGRDYFDLFRGKNVLVTMSRDNDLVNIRDWAAVNVAANEIDAVVIFDNRSKIYSKAEILDALDGIPGLDVAAIVDWPHPYGVTADRNQNWDSDFGQYTAWEVARRRLLRDANSATIGDVDEIALANDGRALWRHAAETESGVLYYPLRDVLPILEYGKSGGSRSRRHSDYHFYDEGALGSTKYTFIPGRLGESNQLLVHTIKGVANERPDAAVARHFMGLHRKWRDGSFGYTHKESVGATEGPLKDQRLLDAFASAEL